MLNLGRDTDFDSKQLSLSGRGTTVPLDLWQLLSVCLREEGELVESIHFHLLEG